MGRCHRQQMESYFHLSRASLEATVSAMASISHRLTTINPPATSISRCHRCRQLFRCKSMIGPFLLTFSTTSSSLYSLSWRFTNRDRLELVRSYAPWKLASPTFIAVSACLPFTSKPPWVSAQSKSTVISCATATRPSPSSARHCDKAQTSTSKSLTPRSP